jgi:hypothetical protein
MSEGKRITLHGSGVGKLLDSISGFFMAATEAAEEFKWLSKAGAQLLTSYLEVRQDPAVKAGLKQIALMEVREAQSRLDTNRNRRTQEKRAPTSPPPRHENKEKVQHRHQEIISGKPVEVEKELKDGTQVIAPEQKREPKKGLTHKLPQEDLQAAVSKGKEASAG